MKHIRWTLLILLVIAGGVYAQRRGRGGDRYEAYDNPRQIPQHAYDENGELRETPVWTNAPGFEKDTFTFVRIKRSSGGGSGGPWDVDTPDSDLNLSWRSPR
jgi:hypothetical protein